MKLEHHAQQLSLIVLRAHARLGTCSVKPFGRHEYGLCTLQDLELLVEKNDGVPPTSYSGFGSLLSKMGLPAAPAEDAPEKLPGVDLDMSKAKNVYDSIPSLKDLGYEEKATTCFHVRCIPTPILPPTCPC